MTAKGVDAEADLEAPRNRGLWAAARCAESYLLSGTRCGAAPLTNPRNRGGPEALGAFRRGLELLSAVDRSPSTRKTPARPNGAKY